MNCHVVHPLWFTTKHNYLHTSLRVSQGRKDKDVRKGWTSTLPEFYARNRGSLDEGRLRVSRPRKF